jgi:fatty-acyl-CoA synthase
VGTGVTVADLLEARAADDAVALRFEDRSWTWREFVADCRRVASVSTSLRAPGPFHVGVLLDNTPAFLHWIGGAALAGAAVVGINATRRGAELATDIRHTDCQLLVTDRSHLGLLDGLELDLPVVLVDGPAYGERLAAAEPSFAPVGGDHVLLLLFTSGSTGAPKAVVCSSSRLAAAGVTAAERFGLRGDDVLYEAMPLFHGNALMANWAPALALGATVALRRRFSASGFLSDVRRFGATYCNYVGRALAYVLATPEAPDDADNPLRLAFGTEAPAGDRERFAARFGCRVVESYGSSEGVISILARPDMPPGALGLPPEGADVAVVDPATGRECPRAVFDDGGRLLNGAEAVGEIVRRDRGSSGFEGYYRNPEADAERRRDGWYWSGDLGYRDADGWFWFAGRGADRLRVDSENLAAAPIERVLGRLPGVVVAAVYPVPDPRTGDQVMAALELVPGATFDPEAFAAGLAAAPDLGTKEAPRFVRVVVGMPLTGSNKVDKGPLRAAAWRTDDPVWWQPERGGPYRRLAPDDVDALAAELERNGRAALAP